MSLCSKYPRHAVSNECMTAGVRSPIVRMGGLDGESCSTDMIFDWLAILGLICARLGGDDEDCDGDNTAVGSGTGESSEDGGDDGTDGDNDSTVMVTVTGMACARLLLRVGSEEETDGCAQDSLGQFGRVLNSCMVSAVRTPLRGIRSDQIWGRRAVLREQHP